MDGVEMKNVIIEAKMLGKTFSNGGIQQHVLKNLDLQVFEGDLTVIMGSSGSGKSTLLYALSGMDRPTLGELFVNDRELTKMNNDQLAKFRRKNCGFIFQQIHLLSHMSVLDNILASGFLLNKNKREIVGKAKHLLHQVDLAESTWNKLASQLSGGEAQRAGIVRALINEPRIIFADEPTGALNSASGKKVLDVLTDVNRKHQSIIMVTHDMKSALRGNRIIYLKDGTIVGELQMEKYDESNDYSRLEKMQAFLTDMGW